MSVPVDVLAVLDQVAGFIGDPDWNPDAESDVEEVRDAVAELIECVDNALRVHRGEGGTKPYAWASLAKALARVKGA